MHEQFAEQYGPYALVAGASEGIGAAFARQIASLGVDLVLVARRAEPLEALAAEIRRQFDVDVRVAAVDLTAPDVDDQLAAATDGLDIGLLIYNAGAAHGAADFHDLPLATAMHLVNLNCVGPVVACHRYGAAMRDRGSGGIVLVGSMAGNAGVARIATYAASKAFDQIFAEGLWAELAPHGVHVLALIAGATDTPALARSGAIRADGYPPMDPADVAKVMRQETPEWIKTVQHPLVAPVYRGLYGGWEGNWVAYNTAHDVVLPGSKLGKLGFLMYPVAEDQQGRFDSYAPDDFKYAIAAREVKA